MSLVPQRNGATQVVCGAWSVSRKARLARGTAGPSEQGRRAAEEGRGSPEQKAGWVMRQARRLKGLRINHGNGRFFRELASS